MKHTRTLAAVSVFALVFGASSAIAQELQQSGSEQMDIQGEHETLNSKPLSKDEAHALLNVYGYSKVKDMERKGDKFTATAEKDGKRKTLVVDTKQGSVREAGS